MFAPTHATLDPHGRPRRSPLQPLTLLVVFLQGTIEGRACDLATYIIDTNATVRQAAKAFGVSKSTVHKDLSERLEIINKPLYRRVKKVLEKNKAERHIRGGIATKRKYKGDSPC